MKKKRPTKKRIARAARPADYEVGYGKPPKATRWKKGESGNRNGRKKGSKSLKTIIRELFNRRVTVRDGDRVIRMSALEAMFLRFLERAMRGDPKAAGFLLEYYEEQTGMPPATVPESTYTPATNVHDFMATKYRQMLKTVGPH
jgi:hypothetical protein